MRLLVIGGTSFIGPAVVRQLAEQGHEITLFHRGVTETDLPESVQHIHCEDAPPPSLGWKTHSLPKFVDELRRLAPDVVLDMVPYGEKDAQVVVETFKGIARRIVGISSQDVYRAYGRLHGTEPGPPDAVPLTEDSPLREKLYPYRSEPPRNPGDPKKWMDDYEKILVEHTFMSSPEFPGTILRLPMVYGPLDYQHRMFEYLKRMNDQRPAILLEEHLARWHWTRGYVENVAHAIALAITNERAAGRIYNVGEKRALSLEEWIKAIGEVVGWQGNVIALPEDRISEPMQPILSYNINANQQLITDTTRIRQELGYEEPVPLDEAIRRTIAWEIANPPAEIDPEQFDYVAEDALLAEIPT